MSSVHELFTHLQKVHRTAVTQYYAALGDRTVVRFGLSDRTVAAVAIPKNGRVDLFLVVRHRIGDGTADACWVWFAGDAMQSGTYQVRLECGGVKWRGGVQSLETSAKEVMAGKRRNGDRQYMCVEATASVVVVEIK